MFLVNIIIILEFLQLLRNDIVGNQNMASNSPYLKIYENFKRKITHTINSKGNFNKKGDVNTETKAKSDHLKEINV